jgi:pimeloyl-ACP methyl ester carboxylesterase
VKVYEFGAENAKTFVMFPCAAEPWWAFKSSAEAMARDFHVYLFMSDGHDEEGTDFVSIEKNVRDAAGVLRQKGVSHVDAMYGVSMGGASVIRFLATEDIPVDKAIIDAGITPYPYPRFVCRLIALWDWTTVMLGTKSMTLMKLAMPPERWTPAGEDPQEHYRKIFDFEKHHFSPKTIYNVFWSTNNYSMPDPVPPVNTEIEYWYGEEEKRARKNDLAYTRKAYPQTVPREFKGLAHAELVLMFPERFSREAGRFLKDRKGRK